MNKTVAVVVDIRCRPADHSLYLEHMARHAAASRSEPGCLQFDVVVPADGSPRVFLYELWEDETSLAAHGATPRIEAFRKETGPLVVSAEVTRCGAVEVPGSISSESGSERRCSDSTGESSAAELSRTMTLPAFKRLALTACQQALQEIHERLEASSGDGFRKLDPSPLLRYQGLDELEEACREKVSELPRQPGEDERSGRWSGMIDRLAAAERPEEAIDEYLELQSLSAEAQEAISPPHKGQSAADPPQVFAANLLAEGNLVQLKVGGAAPTDESEAARRRDAEDSRLMSVGADLAVRLRSRGAQPTPAENTVFQWCYSLLDRGVRLPTRYRGLGAGGFRACQTYLSLADPGPGHLSVTCKDYALLRGTVVHVEHIDRDGIQDKEVIEAYRLPAARNAARVRLHAADEAPVTAFIGRPVFENHRHSQDPQAVAGLPEAGGAKDFRLDLLKTAHMTASACSVMFGNGIADCKVAIERMTASQALDFMRAVAGNVLRDRHRQFLSAAFNINTPLIDDRGPEAELVTDRFQIGLIGIELAAGGGFNKVTWDGASNEVPSRPFTDQLSHAQLVELVHRAHERGLETYISAGMKSEHMRPAAHAGVDGVGIGTSMHYIDSTTKLMGALKPDAIQGVLALRDEAELESLGQAARLLARLDRMHHEGSLDEADEPARLELFEALAARDEVACVGWIERLEAVRSLPDDADHPLIESAKRVLRGKRFRAISGSGDSRRLRLERAIAERDLPVLEEIL